MEALSTVFTQPSWCQDRFAVFIDDKAPGTSTLPPSSGWIDPSFTRCIPTQYTSSYPTFSPGVCPSHMVIVSSTHEVHKGETTWTAGCCQSGFSPVSADPQYLCTSSLTTPMAFLLDPNISTADVYTTLPPDLWIEHDQLTVLWGQSDLKIFPDDVANRYASIMGIALPSITTTDAESGTTSASMSSTAATPISAVPTETPRPSSSVATSVSSMSSKTSQPSSSLTVTLSCPTTGTYTSTQPPSASASDSSSTTTQEGSAAAIRNSLASVLISLISHLLINVLW
ncbi:hypothetical protein GGR57DRAFT_501838 [Xylariaceae sp. FL1272]|nr:hypothetical protein GGR57DRAFT_501838 [Xylariaceae sp. FL1272]